MQIGDRYITVQEFWSLILDDVLNFGFYLHFTDNMPDEPREFMEELELHRLHVDPSTTPPTKTAGLKGEMDMANEAEEFGLPQIVTTLTL